MVQFAPFASRNYVFITGYRTGRRVSPFGHLRIKARLAAPRSFRSLLRPSSALGAKASTVCPYYLDFIF